MNATLNDFIDITTAKALVKQAAALRKIETVQHLDQRLNYSNWTIFAPKIRPFATQLLAGTFIQ